MYGVSLFCLLDLIFAFSYIALNPTELKDYPHQTVSAFNYNVGLVRAAERLGCAARGTRDSCRWRACELCQLVRLRSCV